MCKECYANNCNCDCFFEEVPIEDILSGSFIEACFKCQHKQDLYGDYQADEYDRRKGE
jgi:hypothetical protein